MVCLQFTTLRNRLYEGAIVKLNSRTARKDCNLVIPLVKDIGSTLVAWQKNKVKHLDYCCSAHTAKSARCIWLCRYITSQLQYNRLLTLWLLVSFTHVRMGCWTRCTVRWAHHLHTLTATWSVS